MNALPRSALLAAWGTAALCGRIPVADALRAVHRSDEPHVVRADGADVPPELAGVIDLAQLFDRLRSTGTRALRVVLPAPGDPRGLPGPAVVNAEALHAGECVLVLSESPVALVPEARRFGSELEPGHEVTWHLWASERPSATDLDDLPTVEMRLRVALAEATRTLADLDVVRSRPDASGSIGALRQARSPASELPPGSAPRALRVLDLAWRTRHIVDLAGQDDGAAISAWQSSRRTQTLRGLGSVGRQAVATAVNCCSGDEGALATSS